MLRMNRRRFLWGAPAALGAGAWVLSRARFAQADGLPTRFDRKVLNLTLAGGPDFRHLFVPVPSATEGTYGAAYWKGRATAHSLSETTPAAWMGRYMSDYLPVRSIAGAPVPEFGVLASCAFLHAEIVAGRVAIVCNVEHSTNRDHAHSLLILQSGDTRTGSHATDRDGWGGRLAAAVRGNVLSMTRQRLLYCSLPAGAPRESQVITARNTRAFGLAGPASGDSPQGGKAVMHRALSSYYQALRGAEVVPPTSLYRPFVDHEETLRGFTRAVSERLATNPVPMGIAALYATSARLLTRNANFGEQVRNAYDCFACEGVVDPAGRAFNFRVGSMEYGGWDSHKLQRDAIEPQFREIFGDARGLAALRSALGETMPAALDQHVITVAGEFGRQLRSNGDRGTDHGRGNCVLVLGNAVRGGVYGEMFPMREVTERVGGQNRYERYNQDIDGQTGLARVFGAVCDWVADDDAVGDRVFTSRATSRVEQGVELTRASLFRS